MSESYVNLHGEFMKKLLVLAVSTFFIVGCAHHRDVRPSSNGSHKVVIQTEDKSNGYSNGKSQADHFCEGEKRRAYIVEEGYKYTGSMSEEDYKKGKMVSKIAKGVGSAGYVFGGKKEKNAGGILGIGGQVADSAMGSGYTYTMIFRCK